MAAQCVSTLDEITKILRMHVQAVWFLDRFIARESNFKARLCPLVVLLRRKSLRGERDQSFCPFWTDQCARFAAAREAANLRALQEVEKQQNNL